MKINTINTGDSLEWLKTLPDGVVNTCVTSPPYFGLRNYNVDGQIGLEETPEAYVQKLVELFREVKRVLKDDGTLWLNLGDSYWGGKGQSGSRDGEYQDERAKNGESINQKHQQMGGKGKTRPTDKKHDVIKPKDLIGIPWMVAFALRADGWYLRQDIIWHKPNPMPESVTDRCTKAHEYIFLLSKSARYYYDAEAIRQDGVVTSAGSNQRDTSITHGVGSGNSGINKAKEKLKMALANGEPITANKRSVWTVTTKPFKDAHFATFPEDLIVDCIKAGCPENGIVLDPFGGAGTTAVVSAKLGRNYLLSELNPEYVKISEKRLRETMGMFM